MTAPNLEAWLVLAAAIFVWGLVPILGGGRSKSIAHAVATMLAGSVLALVALVTFRILPTAALTTGFEILVLGGVLLLVLNGLQREDQP